jgi:hypothetical protein
MIKDLLTKKDIRLPEIPCDTKPRTGKGFSFFKEFMEKHEYQELYQKLQERRMEEWTRKVQAFEEDQTFFNAWRYVENHPLFWRFSAPPRLGGGWFHEEFLIHDQGIADGLDIQMVLVNPETDHIDEDPEKNTSIRIWYEVMPCPLGNRVQHRIHAYEADGGGSTYEEAIIMAAREIHRIYGNDRRVLEAEFKEDLF